MQGHAGMSSWHGVKIFIYEFFTLVVLVSSVCRGFADICQLCCHIQGQEKSLNCSWKSLSDTGHTLYVLRLKKHSCGLGRGQTDCPGHVILAPDDSDLTIPSLQNFTAPLGQNWLLIPRKDLITFYPYHLRLTAEGKEVQLNFTYDTNGENVLLEPPEIISVEHEEDNVVVVKWKHQDQEHLSAEQEQELRYRKLGATNWTEVHNDHMDPSSCELTDLEPYLEYELQIRYLAEDRKKGSRWSKTLTFCTPGEVPCGLLDIGRSIVEGKSLLIQWKPLSSRTQRGEILGYDVTYIHGGQTHTEEVQCCHSRLPPNATNIGVSPRNQHGLGYSSWAPPPCSDLTTISGVKVSVNRSGVEVSGGALSPAAGDPHTYLVEWKELTEAGNTFRNWTRLQTTNQNLMLPGDFAPYVPYEVAVFALYHNGCAGVVSTVVYIQEGAPSSGPNVSVHLISSKEAHISWDELPLGHRRGNITSYTIYLNSTKHSLQKSVLGRNNCISGLLSNTAYTVWMTAWTGAGEGPPGYARKFQTTDYITSPLVITGLTVVFMLIAIPLSLWTIWVLHRWFWPRIPNPNLETNQELSRIQNNFNWDLEQENPNTTITIVEEIEPPQQAPKPPEKTFTSGYEKHFLPTPEELMGLW